MDARRGRAGASDPGGVEPPGARPDRRADARPAPARRTPSSTLFPLPTAASVGPDGQAHRPDRRDPVRASPSACSAFWRGRFSSRSSTASNGRRRRRASAPSGASSQARRGALYDRNGVPLAITQEFYHVGVAPNELEDPGSAIRLLVRNLGVPGGVRSIASSAPASAGSICTVRSTRRRSSRFATIKGIHPQGSFQRFYPSRELARPIIGGLEADSARRRAPGSSWRSTPFSPGTPGAAVLLKDRAGRRYASPARVVARSGTGQRRRAHHRRRAAGDRRAGARGCPGGHGGARAGTWSSSMPEAASCWRWRRDRSTRERCLGPRPSPIRSSRDPPPSCSPPPRCSGTSGWTARSRCSARAASGSCR